MSLPRIYADFHNADDASRLRLVCNGTKEDLARHGIELREGLSLIFYTDDGDDEGNPDDLLVKGTVQFNEQEQCWVAAIDWEALWHASDEDSG